MTEKMQHTRPLSPHLQIFKWHITMAVSILHRVTGVALGIGSLLLVGWLWSAAYDVSCFAAMHKFFSSFFGKLLLFGWTAAFYFHFCNGIRHLVWDTGRAFEIHTAERTGWAVVGATGVLTLITWAIIWGMK